MHVVPRRCDRRGRERAVGDSRHLAGIQRLVELELNIPQLAMQLRELRALFGCQVIAVLDGEVADLRLQIFRLNDQTRALLWC